MLRLKREDFENPESMAQFCAVTHLTPERFREEFFHLVKDESTAAADLGLLTVTANPVGPKK
jgi:6-phosphofructokinase 1